MDQDHSLAAPGHGRFDSTRWAVVLKAVQSPTRGGPEALARLCERYWPPLYAFARHRRFSPQDLVRGFFGHLIRSRALGTVNQGKGRFRSFLLASFQNFTAMERRRPDAEKRGGHAPVIRVDWQDAEGCIGLEPEDRLTPEMVYDARWALELLGRATRRLEQEQAAPCKAEAFSTSRPFLSQEGTRAGLTYEEATQKLNIGLPAVKTWIHRLRRRHAWLLREEIAQTVLNRDDVDREARALCDAPVQARGRVWA
jgi:DNA-directed RNA polymerase specialized sigma24 family protein